MGRALEGVGGVGFARGERVERAEAAFEAFEARGKLVDGLDEAQEFGVELVGGVLVEGLALFDFADALGVFGRDGRLVIGQGDRL